MSLIGWLTGGVLQTLIGSIMAPLEKAFTSYMNKEISRQANDQRGLLPWAPAIFRYRISLLAHEN